MKVNIKGIWKTRQVFIDGKEIFPKESQKLRNHSPDGFNWGYGGSGPAQLALGILLKFLSKYAALAFYQVFKFSVVAGWPQSDFDIEIDIEEWFNKKKEENKKLFDRIENKLEAI